MVEQHRRTFRAKGVRLSYDVVRRDAEDRGGILRVLTRGGSLRRTEHECKAIVLELDEERCRSPSDSEAEQVAVEALGQLDVVHVDADRADSGHCPVRL